MTPEKTAIRAFHKRLHAWYAAHGRKTLPWRNTSDPYAIYLSEIMLQQTQVKTVLERYYFPFLKRFPTLNALAKAKQADVLKAWQGLGYYNRAIHLHNAAKACRGTLPDTPDALMALPGIGQNTANAVAAFAFHAPVPVMEANVRRVLARIFALKRPDANTLWQKAEELLDARNPFDYNQAMMDIGAQVCTGKSPQCPICPASMLCKGKTSPHAFPEKSSKKAAPVRKKTIVVRKNRRGQYFAAPRTGRFLRGLYAFCEAPATPDSGKHLGHIRQQYSHFTLQADVYLQNANATGGKHWHTLPQLKKLPMSMAEQKILRLLTI